MKVRLLCIAALILVSLLDFAPFPVGSLLGLYIVIARPRWFRNAVRALYGESPDPPRAS